MIEIFTTTAFNCPYCINAKKYLDGINVSYIEKDISDSVILIELRNRCPTAKTIPQIFVGERYIGGYDDMMLLTKTGEFATLIASNNQNDEIGDKIEE